MAKGYWIVRVDISDPEAYKSYVAANAAAFRKFGAHFLVRSGRYETVEGASRGRNVVIEFKDYVTALACYHSPEYQGAKPMRLAHATSDFVIVEGYDGEQPPRPVSPFPAGPRKGYWIAHVDVTDPEGFQAYLGAYMAPLGKFGGRFLVCGGAHEVVEGRVRSRTVVLEFPSYEAALACYRGPEYQAAKRLRDRKADVDLVIVAGHDGAPS